MVNSLEKWTVFEKRKLARLLTIYPLDAYGHIASKFTDKTAEEVELYIKKMVHSTKISMQINKKQFSTVPENELKAPLETWLDVSKSLVNDEQFDFSSCLAKVMSFISSFEDFPEGDIDGHRQPNYRKIYKFLANVLDGNKQEEVELGNLESAVVLDLIHSLMEVINENDLQVQTNVMKWKYQLMNERDHMGHPIPELLNQASENDFKEFIEMEAKIWDEKRWRDCENREKISLARSAKEIFKQVAAKPGMLDAGTSTSEKDAMLRGIHDSSRKPVKIVTRYIYEADYSLTKKKMDPHAYINSEVFHNKPGRKSNKCEQSTLVTEIVHVVPPKNATIVNIKPRSKKPTLRDDGKYFGLNTENKEEDFVDKDKEDTVVKQMNLDKLREANKHLREKEDAEYEVLHQLRKRKYEVLNKKKDGKKSVKKPKMYSLNPFCLPVNLLDLDS